jgi:peptidoglycan/LPS O-acetylase OafA/YrhL
MITLAALWLARFYFGRPFGISPSDIAAHLIPGTRDLLGTRNIDGIIWTLEIEVKFYALCGVAAPWLRRGSPMILLVPAGIALLYFVNQRYGGVFADHPNLLRLSQVVNVNGQFLVFMFIGTVMNMVYRGIWRAELAMFSFGSIIVIVSIMFANGFQKDYPYIAYSYGAALVVFLIALTWPWIVPGGRLAAFFSNISYPLYVIHAVAGYSILLVLLDLGMKPTLALLLVTGCVIGLSALIHRFIERPTQRLARRVGQRLSEVKQSDLVAALPAEPSSTPQIATLS